MCPHKEIDGAGIKEAFVSVCSNYFLTGKATVNALKNEAKIHL
jgi:hypothetical protein